jgi:uracil-DNA glycosylase
MNTQSWKEFYKTREMILYYDLSWHILFCMLYKHPKFEQINKKLKELVKKNIQIYPLPTQITSAFLFTKADELKVVFIGNEPYVLYDKKYNKSSGLAYSIDDTKIPETLNNIFNNLIKYNHIREKPKNGNLQWWAVQGCLLLNSTLTTSEGQQKEHLNIWGWCIDYIIQYISQYMDNIIFVLWGSNSYKKINLIDLDKHHTIISSHPAEWTANKQFHDYPAFMNYDHFGQINQILKKLGKTEIIWH